MLPFSFLRKRGKVSAAYPHLHLKDTTSHRRDVPELDTTKEKAETRSAREPCIERLGRKSGCGYPRGGPLLSITAILTMAIVQDSP